MTQYKIVCPDGTEIRVSRIRRGQHRWQWQTHEGYAMSTHLDGAKDYATEIGGKFVAVRTQTPKNARSGHPVGLANLLRLR